MNKKLNKRNKKKLESILIIVIACLLVVIVIMGILIMAEKREKATENEKSAQSISTSDSELEVVEEEPAHTEQIITEKKEADYERWLAAGMIVGISLQYTECEFTEIYLASASELKDYADSKGVYVVFNSGGQEIIIHSKPLAEERMEAGTSDLYTKDLGFATFDVVSRESINLEQYQKIEIEELSELVVQSVLVSVYEH